jgi:hypothetical protein
MGAAGILLEWRSLFHAKVKARSEHGGRACMQETVQTGRYCTSSN